MDLLENLFKSFYRKSENAFKSVNGYLFYKFVKTSGSYETDTHTLKTKFAKFKNKCSLTKSSKICLLLFMYMHKTLKCIKYNQSRLVGRLLC